MRGTSAGETTGARDLLTLSRDDGSSGSAHCDFKLLVALQQECDKVFLVVSTRNVTSDNRQALDNYKTNIIIISNDSLS